MRIIDFHTHLDDHWFDAPLMDQTTYLAGLDKTGIERACVFTLMGFYENCPAHNDKLIEQCAKHPDRLYPFITVDPKLGNAAIEEMDRCLATGVFRGVKFHPWLQAFAPSMVKQTMIEILKRAAKHDLPVLFHDGTPPYSTTYQVAATARWVPQAKIVLGHAGLADYVIPAAQLTRDIPNLFSCICCPRAGDVKYLIQTAGADKCHFGSDFGFSDWTLIPDRLDSILYAGLPDDALDKILYTNAAKLLHLI